MRPHLVLAIMVVASCRSDGGVAFNYRLFDEANTADPVATCALIGVSRLRFMVGNDFDGVLDDDELEGRAVQDCTTGAGRFETPSDRLPAGDYNAFAVSLVLEVDDTITNVPSRYPTVANFAEQWTFSRTDFADVLTISEGTITEVNFTQFAGGFPDLQLIAR